MSHEIRVAELFAGVGGFRLGLEGYNNSKHPEWHMDAAGPFKTIWANQWEPGSNKRQFAARCYEERFGSEGFVNEDIHATLEAYEAGQIEIPDADMVVGGFPCQDYSVARTLSQASGIEGKKGVLWWDIYKFLQLKPNTRFCLFENVDRLLKSPAPQRGRDFAIILSCLSELGYTVEWRVVNSAEYGFSQRRKRVYIFAEKTGDKLNLKNRFTGGVMAKAFPFKLNEDICELEIDKNPIANSEGFGIGDKQSKFKLAGVMQDCRVLTADVEADYSGPRASLGDVLALEAEVPNEYFIPEAQRSQWEYLKGSKHLERVAKNGHKYMYSEGAMAFPDYLDRPSRTILTGEGGASPSRFKHVIECSDGRLRRLVPDELDQLQGFPKGWTNTGMSDGNRAFCMGNALVTGVPHCIGKAMTEIYKLAK